MLERFRKTFLQAGEAIRSQAGAIGDTAKEKTFNMFEQYAVIFPKLEEYGLEMVSFAISVAISPAMEVVFKGSAADFPVDRITEITRKHKGETVLNSVLRTMKTTLEIHEKTKGPQFEDIHLKIVVKIPPEIKVVLGEPTIL